MSALLRRAVSLLLITVLLPVSGCGYLIFSERVGQPNGNIDWGVFALDAVGLLFGVIPGVIAFAVDFSTGCIYLPSAPVYGAQPVVGEQWQLVATVSPFATEADVRTALQQALAQQPQLQPALASGAIEWQRTLPPG